MKRVLEWLGVILLLLAPAGIMPLWTRHHYANTPASPEVISFLGTYLIMGNVGIFIVGVSFCFEPAKRAQGIRVAAGSALLFVSTLFGIRNVMDTQDRFFTQLSTDLEPVVDAAHRFEKIRQAPPKSLEDLEEAGFKQEALSASAQKMVKVMQFRRNPAIYDGNPWALQIPAHGALSFDSLLYLPKQNYPRYGYGGVLKRMGKWAYVNE
jgi:hypothetical protein